MEDSNIDEIKQCIVRLTTLVEKMEQLQNDHEARLRKIESKGSDSFDKLVWMIAGIAVAAIGSLTLSSIGL